MLMGEDLGAQIYQSQVVVYMLNFFTQVDDGKPVLNPEIGGICVKAGNHSFEGVQFRECVSLVHVMDTNDL